MSLKEGLQVYASPEDKICMGSIEQVLISIENHRILID